MSREESTAVLSYATASTPNPVRLWRLAVAGGIVACFLILGNLLLAYEVLESYRGSVQYVRQWKPSTNPWDLFGWRRPTELPSIAACAAVLVENAVALLAAAILARTVARMLRHRDQALEAARTLRRFAWFKLLWLAPALTVTLWWRLDDHRVRVVNGPLLADLFYPESLAVLIALLLMGCIYPVVLLVSLGWWSRPPVAAPGCRAVSP